MTTAPGPFEDDPFPSVWSKWSQQIFPRRCLRPHRPVRALLLAIAFCCLLFLWLVRSTGEVRVLHIFPEAEEPNADCDSLPSTTGPSSPPIIHSMSPPKTQWFSPRT